MFFFNHWKPFPTAPCLAVLLLGVFTPGFAPAFGQDVQTWFAGGGTKKIQAEFLRLTDDGVVLKVQPSGNEVEVKLSALSLESQLQAIKLGKPHEWEKPLIKFVLEPEVDIPPLKAISLAQIQQTPFYPEMSLQEYVDATKAEYERWNFFVQWQALPDKMQDDVALLISKGGKKIGKAPLVQLKMLFKNVNTIFAKKRDFVFNHPKVADDKELKQQLANVWPVLTQLSESLADEKLWDEENFEQENVPEWIARLSAVLMANKDSIMAYADHMSGGMASSFSQVQLEVIDAQDEAGQVQAAIPAMASFGVPPEAITFRKVKGVWLAPKTMNMLRTQVDTLLAQIDQQDEAKIQGQLRTGLAAVSVPIGQLAAAQTQEEFNTVVDGLIPLIEGLQSQIQDAQSSFAPPPGAMAQGGRAQGGRPGAPPANRSSGPPKGLQGLTPP